MSVIMNSVLICGFFCVVCLDNAMFHEVGADTSGGNVRPRNSGLVVVLCGVVLNLDAQNTR